ncbi:MAG TPA: hypothetical protein VJ953_06135 [Saprospiraceae bacterium]|nr:hypothetical protein [Saprospiraceae bacterium]
MMKKYSLLGLFMFLVFSTTGAQWLSEAERDSINQLNRADHQLMMEKLGLHEMRPGPSGDPEASNAANADESQAKTYESLPDPLIFNKGEPVESAQQWQRRKKELFEWFDREIYGRVPENIPEVTWEIVVEKDTVEGDLPVRYRELLGRVDNSIYPDIEVNIQLTLVTPVAAKKALPVILHYGWGFSFPNNQPGPSWKEQLIEQGWAYAIIVPTSYQADNGAGLRGGIIGLMNQGEPRDPDDWGTLRAWAWGASRAVDLFGTLPEMDAERVGIEGLSRYGKAALVTMAYEPRIAIGFIGSSGAGGAKILRRNFGEQVENLASSYEYHWFAGNFIKYGSRLTANDLPVDAHELVALCAPRPVFISSGSAEVEGTWVDAKGMFLGGAYASPVYELLGAKGMGTTEFPPQETTLMEGDIAFRQHAGGHTTAPNWPYFIEFARRYFK